MNDNIYIDKDAVVEEGAVIFPNNYIGAGSVAIHLTLDGDMLTCRVTGGAGADEVPTFSDDPVWW